jgi:2-phosphosulfolactate phosphatase
VEIAIVEPGNPDAMVGTVVVIDVLRAFTTAAFAIESGAREISLVTTIDEALELRERLGDAQLVGEDGGYPIEGFDAGNSPAEFVDQRVGPRWIQRTTAGTRAARLAVGADHLLVTGLVTLQATVTHIRRLAPPVTALVISGRYGRFDGEDDRACADLIAARLLGQTPDPEPFIERVKRSQAAAKFLDQAKPGFPSRDLELACELDRFDFAMAGHREGDRLVVRPVTD